MLNRYQFGQYADIYLRRYLNLKFDNFWLIFERSGKQINSTHS